jgi:hypothetical protein
MINMIQSMSVTVIDTQHTSYCVALTNAAITSTTNSVLLITTRSAGITTHPSNNNQQWFG